MHGKLSTESKFIVVIYRIAQNRGENIKKLGDRPLVC